MKIAAFDVDNTIIEGQSQRLLLSYLRKRKLVSLYYYIVVSIWFIAYKIHLARDPRKVVSFAYSFLKGKAVPEIEELMNGFMRDSLKVALFPDALNEIKACKQAGIKVIILSNAPDIIIKPLSVYLGADSYICTKLEIMGGYYTGHINGDIMYGDNKKGAMLELCKDLDCSRSDIAAYGDHISDLPVLEMADVPVAVNPSKDLAKIAIQRGWRIHNWSLQ